MLLTNVIKELIMTTDEKLTEYVILLVQNPDKAQLYAFSSK